MAERLILTVEDIRQLVVVPHARFPLRPSPAQAQPPGRPLNSMLNMLLSEQQRKHACAGVLVRACVCVTSGDLVFILVDGGL